MSEGTSLLERHPVDRKMTLFQAQTTHFQINPALAMRCHESSPDAIPVILRGSKTCKTIIGRGHDATIQIGKANKRVSREHVVIEHKPQMGGFELTILSPNGALVDHIVFVEGEHVPVIEGTTIEIVGTKIIFQVPDDSSSPVADMEDMIETPLEASLATAAVDARTEVVVDEKSIQRDNIPVVATEQSAIASAATRTTTATQSSSTQHTKSTLNSIIKSTASKLKETARSIIKKPMTMEDEIIQALVHTRKSTMTCADITKRLQGQTAESVLDALKSSAAIGCVKRLGKTADGSPKEDLYYYKPELDPDQERQKRYSDVGRSARKCTMKDTQYFFRIPPKLPHHKTAKSKKRESTASRKSRQTAAEEDDAKSTSSGDVSDMEVYELFKDV